MTEAKKIPSSEAEGKPKKVGCLLESLNTELFRSVVDIYDNVFGGDGRFWFNNQTINAIHEMLSRSNVAEFRYGSKFSDNSKLEVTQQFSLDPKALGKKVIGFEFYENTSIRPEKQAELERLKLLFGESVTNLLTEKGVAILLD